MKVLSQDQALQALDSVDPVAYASERNYLGKSTRLSVYITRGVLTLPQINGYLAGKFTAQQRYKLTFELAWREYWQREWVMRGDAIFADIKREQIGVDSEDLSAAVSNANTGIQALDNGIQELYETGYIHNHMRMWLSGMVCNIAHTKWQKPAQWMYYHLLDGDPASNSLSWQWVAGTFSSKKYLPAQDNINHYSRTKQSNTFLDLSYEQLEMIATPEVLQAREQSELAWSPPQGDTLLVDPTKPTLLYHSFWLNSDWHDTLDANRILVVEPRWFNRFPVSQKVMRSILDIARDIPALQVYVGEQSDLMPRLGKDVRYISHPSVNHWIGTAEQQPRLFPLLPMRSYNSFMSFWKQCEKYL